jgi:hypothetical protein
MTTSIRRWLRHGETRLNYGNYGDALNSCAGWAEAIQFFLVALDCFARARNDVEVFETPASGRLLRNADLILRSALQGDALASPVRASRRMAARHGLAAILRDAA